MPTCWNPPRLLLPVLVGVLAMAGARAQAQSCYPVYPATTSLPELFEPTQFGYGVDLDAGSMLVGVPGADPAGAAFVFNISTGEQTLRLTPPDSPSSALRLGSAVALDGTTAIVGGSGAPFLAGRVDVYDAASGQHLRTLTPNDSSTGDDFGGCLAISGNLIAVGAFNKDSAYLFDATTGVQLHVLTADDGQAGDHFGVSVAIDGNTVLVGADSRDGGSISEGAAYVFDATTGLQTDMLLPNVATFAMRFGRSVALDGDTALIGAVNAGVGGEAFVFDVPSGTQQQRLIPGDGATLDLFGSAVALDGNRALVGAENKDFSLTAWSAGSAYLYDITTGQQQAQFWPSASSNPGTPSSQSDFGADVALHGDLALMGASGTWVSGPLFAIPSSGRAYLYDLAGGPWTGLGQGLAGVAGMPSLSGGGDLSAGSVMSLALTDAAPNSSTTLVLGFSHLALPIKGGMLVPDPALILAGLPTDATGSLSLPTVVPPGLPPCFPFYVQFWTTDATLPKGLSVSNGLLGTTP